MASGECGDLAAGAGFVIPADTHALVIRPSGLLTCAARIFGMTSSACAIRYQRSRTARRPEIELTHGCHPVGKDLRKSVYTLHRVCADGRRKYACVHNVQLPGSPYAKLRRDDAISRAQAHLVGRLHVSGSDNRTVRNEFQILFDDVRLYAIREYDRPHLSRMWIVAEKIFRGRKLDRPCTSLEHDAHGFRNATPEAPGVFRNLSRRRNSGQPARLVFGATLKQKEYVLALRRRQASKRTCSRGAEIVGQSAGRSKGVKIAERNQQPTKLRSLRRGVPNTVACGAEPAQQIRILANLIHR
jgi:hypothetical protein